jgi:HK97 family phage major capsid protein
VLSDASFNVEAWMMRKVADGFRNTISAGIIAGDGVGKPSGILNPARCGVLHEPTHMGVDREDVRCPRAATVHAAAAG